MSEITQKVGLLIKESRKSKGLTQKELAEKIGVTKSIITNYEAGKQNLTVETLNKVAEALGLELTIGMK